MPRMPLSKGPVFQNYWHSGKKTCLFWICGYPGSGKKILSAYLLEYLSGGKESPMLRKGSNSPCYFFCDESIGTRRDGTAILRGLIHQLGERRRQVIKYVKAAYDLQGPNFQQNFNELWKIFVAIASDTMVGPVNVAVDAIDECEEETRGRLLQSILKLVKDTGRVVHELPLDLTATYERFLQDIPLQDRAPAPNAADPGDADGWTPLSWALFGRAPKTRDRNGRSPLAHAAGYGGYLEVVQQLLAVDGTEAGSTSNTSQTPLSIAQASGHDDLVKVLLQQRKGE
ncbi:hypothetical protein MBM_04674 [Drepanopeziza brunnea f. sp. 'multigermtubi' MB_m1]|uniref:Nephrocystin 3-like N-terminal domain-containing protein n=1 Tax=Marssonina brunnea f. sp. multigermtubi (strain MB_m1) TaxID=1072389 RepID=K1WX37_MARBU|nr:uncharacterized protein MBM_04674 [Drepanopeziza brunnea f. sp. 'multigermtubi' MB_m1]EKD17097.1 hypothetical protein MBM_04674 [Drepanopeziza brunnea f. sp. 'multigermtubi' MB_m1]